jgi:hypothetical protein
MLYFPDYENVVDGKANDVKLISLQNEAGSSARESRFFVLKIKLALGSGMIESLPAQFETMRMKSGGSLKRAGR